MIHESQLAKSEIRFAPDFGDPQAEYDAFATGAAVVECWRHRTLLKLTGDDRHKWLHNFCTNDIKQLQSGAGCEVFFTNVKARILGHGYVFATADALWIESVAGQEDHLFEHFDRYIITEDVEIQRLSDSHAQLLLAGPLAARQLESFCNEPLDLNEPLANRPSKIAGIEIGLRRLNVETPSASGRHPWLVVNCLSDQYQPLWNQLTAEGPHSVRPVGTTAWEARRIEAVFPVYGTDITDQQMAPEVGRNVAAISYTKGCYLGQEPIARLDAMGHTNRELRGIHFDSDPGLSVGDAVKAASGDDAGKLTSIATVPGADAVVALGYLKRTHMKSGEIVLGANNTPGKVYNAQ